MKMWVCTGDKLVRKSVLKKAFVCFQVERLKLCHCLKTLKERLEADPDILVGKDAVLKLV